jgi:signal transduction histidine kinase
MVPTHAHDDVLAEHPPLADRVLAVTTDMEGVVTWCSPAFERLLGHAGESLVGREVPPWLFDADEVARRTSAAGVPFGPRLFLVDPREFGRRSVRIDLGVLDRRRAARDEGAPPRPSACDWTLCTHDDRRVVVSVSVRSLRDDAGHQTGYIAVGVDVTEERRTRQLLAEALQREQAASRRLEELDRVRNEFVTTASHELRTPLTSISGYLEVMDNHLDGSPQSRQLLERVRRNASRMQQLADELLLVSAPDAPTPTFDEVVDLRQVLEGAHDILEPLAHHHGGSTRLETGDQTVLVRGDLQQLERVLLRLVDNALKFGDGDREVVCRVDVQGGDAVLEVADTGPGIAPDDHDQVFERFYRGAASLREGVPGAGLGLSVARTLVERHGGAITLHPNGSRGTVARVHLPRLREEPRDDRRRHG